MGLLLIRFKPPPPGTHELINEWGVRYRLLSMHCDLNCHARNCGLEKLCTQKDPAWKSPGAELDRSVPECACLTSRPHCHSSEEACSGGLRACPRLASEIFKPRPSELGIWQDLALFKVLLVTKRSYQVATVRIMNNPWEAPRVCFSSFLQSLTERRAQTST